jgi:peptide/nickel transport system ATP-binding protein
MMDSGNILEVNGLKVVFGKADPAIRGIDFCLKKGHTLGIVGESGSGKSVTALSIMRLLQKPGKISAGVIHFQNSEGVKTRLTDLPEKEMRKFRGIEIAMIFQEPMTSLNPVLTCGSQITEMLRLHLKLDRKSAKERTLDLFRQVKLPRPESMFAAYPHELSGGQKQRVMIAMAISCHPAILIADEPTTALDVTVQKEILDLIMELQAEMGMSVIFISHDLGVIGEIADEVAVMYRGEIVEQGDILTVFEEPQHPYTQGLLACRPRLDLAVSRLPTVEAFLKGETQQPENRINRPEPAPDHPKPILKVEDLNTWFPVRKGFFGRSDSWVKAVDGISFEVFPGETMGLVGESGCGKTTLGRSIIRLIEPTSGSVTFEDMSILQLEPDALRKLRRDIQIIFQDPYSSLNPRIPVGKAILEPMQVHGIGKNEKERKTSVKDLLDRVGLLPEHADRYPHAFSGGQRQRICIARALALNPRFLICDESVSALDVSVQAQVLNLLKDLQDEFGFTYIFISHDLSVVKFMSDRLLVMKDGKICESGASADVYSNPKSEYTRRLIEAVPKGTLPAIRSATQKRSNYRQVPT